MWQRGRWGEATDEPPTISLMLMEGCEFKELTNLRESAICPTMNAPKNDLLHAIELTLDDKWDASHEIVQRYETDATAAWIHAVLHKLEGDLGNARYWYRRADRMSHVAEEPRAELAAIQVELTTDEHR
jgi:hypothetical protein